MIHLRFRLRLSIPDPGETDPDENEDITVTLNVADKITEVKYATVDGNGSAPADSAYTAAAITGQAGSKSATISVASGKKLYLKITAESNYTAGVTGKTIGADGVCEYGVIEADVTIAITAEATTTPNPDEGDNQHSV